MTLLQKFNPTSFSVKHFTAYFFIVFSLFFSSSWALADTPTIKKLIEEGVNALLEKDASTAIEKLDQVLLLSPNHPEATFRKGQALFLNRQAKSGLDSIIKSTRLAPSNVRYSLYLGRVYMKQRKADKAMVEYQRVIDTGSRDVEIKKVEMLLSLATGRALAKRKEMNAALLIFNSLLLEYPDDPQVLFNIGNAYMQLNRIEEAENIFVKLHSTEEKNKVVNMSLAKIYERTKRPSLAMKHLKLIMGLNLNDMVSKNATIQYYIIKGRQALENREWESAISSFQKVINIDPKRTEAFFNISMANLQLGNTNMAEKGFLSVLKVTPNDYSARLNLAIMYFDTGKIEEAKTQFQFIIDNDRSKRYSREAKKRLNLLHSLLADKALKSGNIEEGLVEYEKALNYFSANIKASFTRGNIFIKQKKFSEARKEFESVIKFDPTNMQARANLGRIYEKLTLFSKAAEQYEIVMENDRESKAGKYAASKWKITKGRGFWVEKRLTEAEKVFKEVTLEQQNNYQAFAFLGILQSSKGKLREAAISYQRVLDLRPTNYAIRVLLGKVYEQLGLDSLAANEYRSILFAGGNIAQVPEAERRLAVVEARLSGFSNTLTYGFGYDSNLTLNDAFPVEEVRSNLALSFNYAMKTRDDLSFTLSWSPTYSTYRFNQTDYLISVLQTYFRFGTPDNNWNLAFSQQDQDSLVYSAPLSKSTSVNLGKSKKIFTPAIFSLASRGFEGENIATTMRVDGGVRQISAIAGNPLESILATLSTSFSQQLRWGIRANAGYTLSVYRNLKYVETYGGQSRILVDGVSGLETVVVNRTLVYSSDDYEYSSHSGNVSLSKTLAPGVIGSLVGRTVFTGYSNVDSGSIANGIDSRRQNLGLTLTPSITYLFFKDIRFVLSGTVQKTVSNLPVGLSIGQVENREVESDEALRAIASFQSYALGGYSRFTVDASFVMNF